MSIGKNIAKYRKAKKITQENLGTMLGVTNQSVSKWENNISLPDVMLLPKIAEALDVTLDDLFSTNEKCQEEKTIKQIVTIDSVGQLSFTDSNRVYISSSPIAIIVSDKKAYLPLSADFDGYTAIVTYPCGKCTFTIEQKNGYSKITVTSVPNNVDALTFGPYLTNASSYGEVLGAGWFDDGSVVCIQSLLPKVVGGIPEPITEDFTLLRLTERKCAADSVGGNISLQCSVLDMSEDAIIDAKNTIRVSVPGEDGKITGASIALIGAESSDVLIDVIGDMELLEGLPHPTYKGNYAKKDKRVSSQYLIVRGNNFSNKELIDMASRGGFNCVYFSDIFSSWGHFNISSTYPDGATQVHKLADYAEQNGGIVIGAHTLSAFIHKHDPYVTPIPHPKLLAVNKTKLLKDISENDTEIYIRDANNYSENSALNYIRINDEIIAFKYFDPNTLCLCGCVRGECGTKISAHYADDIVLRLADHGYKTLFPDIELQNEMATNLGKAIVACGIRRLSFDGLEGCYSTGAGEYALAKFVKTVFDITGNEFTCDASRTTHYLWHALCYANWGEPWSDTERRGGQHMYRANNIPFFKRNLIPLMMGWYSIYAAKGRFEATLPENMEFMLSRSIAFDAGMAITVRADEARKHGLFNEYLDTARLWGDFRHKADIPENIRHEMQLENSNWHLEKTDNGWILTRLMIHREDLEYYDKFTETEVDFVGIDTDVFDEKTEFRQHIGRLSVDAPTNGDACEIYRFRIRVGEPGYGIMIDPEIVEYGLRFKLTAIGGDYLVYNGGTEIYHYDKNFNVKQIVQSKSGGREFAVTTRRYLTIKYISDNNPTARYILTDFRKLWSCEIKPKT